MDPQIDPALDSDSVAAAAVAAVAADPSILDSPAIHDGPDPQLQMDAAVQGKTNEEDGKQSGDGDDSPGGQGEPSGGKTKKAKGIVPGSGADFRRREANRLAAVRSRYRAHDKRTNLQKEKQLLDAETERLKAEIARLESESGIDPSLYDVHSGVPIKSASEDDVPSSHNQAGGVATGSEDTGRNGGVKSEEQSKDQKDGETAMTATSAATVKKGGIGVGRLGTINRDTNAPGSASATDTDTVTAQQQTDEPTSGDSAQDSHSRTILAALMSDAVAGVDGAFGPADGVDEDEWMRGVEDMFKEAEASGRLGELAAVAAGRGDDGQGSSGQAEDANGDQSGGAGSEQGGAASGQQASVHGLQGAQGTNPSIRQLVYSPEVATSATSAAMAVSLNVEVERLLREDLVATRLAIGRIERQIAALQGQSPPDNLNVAQQGDEDGQALPRAMFSTDPDVLNRHSDEQTEHTRRLVQAMPAHREKVMQAKAEKMEGEMKLAAAVMELQKLIKAQGTSSEDRARIVGILQGLTGYIGSLIGSVENPSYPRLNRSFSSPAIALRTRGRPSKGVTGLFNLATGLFNRPRNSSSKQSAIDTGSPLPLRRPKRKSTLSKQASSSRKRKASASVEGDAPGTSTGQQAEAEGQNTVQDQVDLGGGEDLQMEVDGDGNGNGNEIENENDNGQNSTQTETERLLHHLRDTSTFADLLPPDQDDDEGHDMTQENEQIDPALVDASNTGDVQATQAAQSIDPASQQGTTPATGAAETGVVGDDGGNGAVASGTPTTDPSVLSRLKKGPPGSCDICCRTETSVWRKLTLAGEDYKVCNACGLYHIKFGVIRPAQLWGDGKSIKKRRTGPRGSTASNTMEGQAGEGDTAPEVGEGGAAGKDGQTKEGESGGSAGAGAGAGEGQAVGVGLGGDGDGDGDDEMQGVSVEGYNGLVDGQVVSEEQLAKIMEGSGEPLANTLLDVESQ